MSTDPVNDKERRILEPREDAIAVAFTHAYQYAAYRHAAVGAFEGRLRELGFAVTPLDAERTSHPPAASAAELREAAEELVRRARTKPSHRPADELSYEGWIRSGIDGLAAALAAAPPRVSEPAEAGRVCGCTADTELAAGPGCTACGHRDHGADGCRAQTEYDILRRAASR